MDRELYFKVVFKVFFERMNNLLDMTSGVEFQALITDLLKEVLFCRQKLLIKRG